MKKLYILVLIISLFPAFSFGQAGLPESRRSSYELFVYKLNEKDVRSLYLKGKDIEESMLHTLVATCPEVKDIPPLPRGNYITVRVAGNKLEYSDHTVDNFYYGIVSDESTMIILSDTTGNVISNATVKSGSKRLKFDETTQTYNTSRVKNKDIVEIDNGGVFHYIRFENPPYFHSPANKFLHNTRLKIKNAFNSVFAPKKVRHKNKYNGFVVFSKPKYKPGETVKFKAYIHDRGKPYKHAAEVRLTSYYFRKDTTLCVLQPYRPGMFEWEFKLSDSLKLRLDSNYGVALKTSGKRPDDIQGYFYYEEYELGRITFEAKPEKERYVKGDTVRLELSARDENGLPVYDGRVNVTVRPNLYGNPKYYSDKVFIPDEAWKYSFGMDGKSSYELVIPDSAFVDQTAMYYFIECSFLDSGNEKHNRQPRVYMDRSDSVIDIAVEKGIMTVKELTGGQSVAAKALLTAYNSENRIVRRDSVTLPYSFPVPWAAKYYTVTTGAASGDFSVEGMYYNNVIGHRFFRENGYVRLVVDNPAGFPFWYTVRKGKNIIERGHTASDLDYSYKDIGENGYTMQLSYLLGGRGHTIDGSLPYVEKNISVDVNTAGTVYPGQTAPVEVTVKDRHGRPVRNADVTAYAYTSKFGSNSPNVTVFGKAVTGKRFVNQLYNTNRTAPRNAKAPLDWELWKRRMGLDSIEYYKFLYPEAQYVYSEKLPRGEATQIAPYVVIDGEVQGVHILWIDEQPHYFHQAEQLNVYSFPVPAGTHTLKFRTYDREITAADVPVAEGTKTIVSVNGKHSAGGITVTEFDRKEKGVLSDREMAMLADHMITVDNSCFGTVFLEGNNQPVEIPAMIDAGGVRYYLNPKVIARHDYWNRTPVKESLLVGPFPYRGFSTGGRNIGTLYSDINRIARFGIEGGYRYSIYYDNYVRQRSWGQNPIERTIKPFTPDVSFDRNALTAEEFRGFFRNRLADRMEQERGTCLSITPREDSDRCRLKLDIGYFADKKTEAKPVLICLTRQDKKDNVDKIYYGGTRDFDQLPKGDYRIDLIFRDYSWYSFQMSIKENGLNYAKVDSIVPAPDNSYIRLVLGVPVSRQQAFYSYNPILNIMVVPAERIGVLNADNYDSKVITGRVLTSRRQRPVTRATISIEGTQIRTVTDSSGKFTLPYPGSRNLLISAPGYISVSTRSSPGYHYRIHMQEDDNGIYYVKERVSFTGSAITVGSATVEGSRGIDVANLLSHKIVAESPDLRSLNPSFSVVESNANIRLRGASTGAAGLLSDGEILSDELLSDGEISSGKSNFPEGWRNANTLRTNFHDDAFWHPALSTGKDGRVTFEVTYPDDITNWNANFIAVGGRRQSDSKRLNVRSFKPLNAQLFLPLFAIEGDSLNAAGLLTNHLGDTVKVKRTIEAAGRTGEENLILSTSHTDNIPVAATGTDSIKITYSLTMDDGYFDGERRAIPVYERGVLETHGTFAVINDTLARRFATDPALGPVTVHAEASAMQMFLDEIDRVDKYAYLCNEQMASKIKALLSKKRICSMVGTTFRDNKKIEALIKKLSANKNGENLWGWWNRDKTELWISKHVVEAMLDAQAEGYRVDFDSPAVTHALMRELNNRLSSANAGAGNKSDLLNLLELLGKLRAAIDYRSYYGYVSSMPDASLNDTLRTMEVMQLLNTGQKPRTDAMLKLASQTMMGSTYWSEKYRRCWSPNIGDVENTLTAYRVLRRAGGYDRELEKIRNYFFEMRRNGSWQNTYESSRIVETIMPDLLKPDGFREATLNVNGIRFDRLPVTVEFAAGVNIDVRKEGTVPVFFTAYQQAWNSSPERVSKGFSVQTVFCEGRDTVTVLQAGKSVDLRVRVTADSDAEYVMIEVPIPAGCSYESKSGNFRSETHSEYHKEKAAIFCNRLTKGKHDFIIRLIPRFTGLYHVNPAKVELMYFPVFFGRDDMKIYNID